MLQFKNGQFQEIDKESAKSILRRPGERHFGFERVCHFGNSALQHAIEIDISSRDNTDFDTFEWLVILEGKIAVFPSIYCDSDADFMTLFLQLGPLIGPSMPAIAVQAAMNRDS